MDKISFRFCQFPQNALQNVVCNMYVVFPCVPMLITLSGSWPCGSHFSMARSSVSGAVIGALLWEHRYTQRDRQMDRQTLLKTPRPLRRHAVKRRVFAVIPEGKLFLLHLTCQRQLAAAPSRNPFPCNSV